MKRGARIDVALVSEEKPFVESPGKVRLERSDPRFVDALMTRGALGEALDLANVARRGDDQRALAHDPGDTGVPPSIERFPSSTTCTGALSPSQ